MKPDDRVMIIGVTKSPFGEANYICTCTHTYIYIECVHYNYYVHGIMCIDAEVKGLCGMYPRIIMVPRPDYASRVSKLGP